MESRKQHCHELKHQQKSSFHLLCTTTTMLPRLAKRLDFVSITENGLHIWDWFLTQ